MRRLMPPKTVSPNGSPLDNERGVALIIVLLMLGLLTILGTTLFTASTTDIKIAGNYKTSLEGFYTAEAGMDFALSASQIYTAINPSTGITVWPATGQGKVLDPTTFAATTTNNPGDTNFNRIQIPRPNYSGIYDYADVKVELVGTGGAVPAGMGTQVDAGISPGSSFKANTYAVTIIGHVNKNPNTSVSVQKSNPSIEIESQVCRLMQQ